MRIIVDGAARLHREKQEAIQKVNELVDQVRRVFITPIIGQEMIYMEKEAEARLYLADPAPNLAQYPFIASEAGITAPTAYEVAQMYINLGAQWRVVGSMLEQVRLGSIGAIEGATTLSQINAAVGAAQQTIGGYLQ